MLLGGLSDQPSSESWQNDVDGAQDLKQEWMIDIFARLAGEFDDDLPALFGTGFGNPTTNARKLFLSH